MKSATASPLTEFVGTPYLVVRTHSGPMPTMNSAFFDSVQGFLNRRSTSHSVECRLKSDVTPASSSKRFSIGVTSTATVGPKLDPSPVTLCEADPPTSITAAGSLSSLDWAKAFPKERQKNDAINTDLAAFRAGLVLLNRNRDTERRRLVNDIFAARAITAARKMRRSPGARTLPVKVLQRFYLNPVTTYASDSIRT
jgi:hypothetical protein